MRAQAAIEFLTTYGFMFIILGLMLTIIAGIALSTKASIPQQCNTVTGFNCEYVLYYSNTVGPNSIITFSLSNEQSVPISITGFNVTVKNYTAHGSCSVSYLYPGNLTACTAQFPYIVPSGGGIDGTYVIDAQYCNSPAAELQKTTCTYTPVAYSGSFSTSSSALTTTSSSTSTSSITSTSSTSTSTSSTSTVFPSARNLYCAAGYNGAAYTNLAYYAPISSTGTGTWAATATYPQAVDSLTCFSDLGLIYCGGGQGNGFYSNNFYYAPASSGGLGSWTPTVNYPLSVGDGLSCTLYNGFVYCVGGYGGSTVANTYYSPVSGAGLGAWNPGTSYPVSLFVTSCAAYSNYIYCVDGNTGSNINTVYYAPISSTGIGTWSTGTVYPQATNRLGCVAYSGYIYCVGPSTNVYYAPISSTGVGTWTSTTSYPTSQSANSCVLASNNYLVCNSAYQGGSTTGTVYAAPVSSTGVGTWTASSSYPTLGSYTEDYACASV